MWERWTFKVVTGTSATKMWARAVYSTSISHERLFLLDEERRVKSDQVSGVKLSKISPLDTSSMPASKAGSLKEVCVLRSCYRAFSLCTKGSQKVDLLKCSI